MKHTKKIIGASGAAIVMAGAMLMTSVSADDSMVTTSATSASATENTGLVLKARIEANYKVVGDFTPLSDKKVQLYKVIVSYSNGAKNFVFTVPANTNTFTDWHARQNMVNTYTISALLEDGTTVTGNSVKVVMGANGEVTTEDALTSTVSSSGNTNGRTDRQQMNQGIRDDRMQMNQGIKDDRMKMNQGIKDDKMKMQQENMENRQMMGNNMNKPPMGTGELKDFIKSPLSPEEQKAFRTLLQTQQTEREALMKDSTLSPEDKKTKMKELMTAHMTAILAYVSTDKQDAFKKMMEDRMAEMEKNHDMRMENRENRQEFREGAKEQRQEFREGAQEQRQEFKMQVKEKKQALSEKNHALLEKLIQTLPLEKLQAILAKVEKAASMTKKERILAQLNEIGDMVQDKIDELTGTSSEDTVVQDILGTDTSSATKTQ